MAAVGQSCGKLYVIIAITIIIMGNSSSSTNDESSKYKEEEVTALVANCSPFKGDKAEGGGDKTPSKHTSENSGKSFHAPNRTPQNQSKKSKNNHPTSYNMEAPEDQIAPTVARTATLEAPPIFEELQLQPPSALTVIEEGSGIRRQQLQQIDSLHAQDYGKEGGTDQIRLPANINQQIIINNPQSYVKPDPESPIGRTWKYDRNDSIGGRGGGSTRAGGINRVVQGNNNNISNNHLPPVVHNVGHHTNGHLNQQPNLSIPPYNSSNLYRGGGVLYHNQPVPGGGGYPNGEQHPFVGGNINQPLHRHPPNNMQWQENRPMPGGGGYPNGEQHNFAGGNVNQPLHRHTPNNMQSFGVGGAGGNHQQSMYPYPANNPPQYAERRGVGNHIQILEDTRFHLCLLQMVCLCLIIHHLTTKAVIHPMHIQPTIIIQIIHAK